MQDLKRFQLRRPEHNFIDGLASLLNDPSVSHWLGGARSVATIRAAIDGEIAHWAAHGWGPWVVVDKESTRPVVGRGGIRWVEVLGKPEVELFYAISPAYWKKGLGSFVARAALDMGFHAVGLSSIIVFTIPTNMASLRLINKFGFVREREFKHADLSHILFRLNQADYETISGGQ
jgi:RimJ/RimL family protein N-acetyltransferase